MTALALYWLFLRVVLLSFSGFATVPLLREALVLDRGILTDTQVTGVRLAPQAMLTPWRTALIIVGTLVLAITTIKPVWIIAVAAVLGLVIG